MEDESGREAEIMDITASDKERGVILVPTGLVLSILHFQTTTSKQRLQARRGNAGNAGALVFWALTRLW